MEEAARTAFRDAFMAGLRPDPVLTVSEWADEHRMLPSRASAEPGPWRDLSRYSTVILPIHFARAYEQSTSRSSRIDRDSPMGNPLATTPTECCDTRTGYPYARIRLAAGASFRSTSISVE